MKRTRPLPRCQTVEDHGSAMQPVIVHHEGHDYLVEGADGLTTGLVRTGDAKADYQICVTLWSESAELPLGTALAFRPTDEMLDAIIGSLTQLRDEKRAHAAELAAAALRKAAGR